MDSPEPSSLPGSRTGTEALEYRSSVCEVLTHIAAAFPGTRLLALGQTALWDEAMKAVVRRALDDHGIEITMLLGVHDTDYFSKLPGHSDGEGRYRLLPHNDGSTRDLWTAAGEISQLFGSETVVTREMYQEHGVAFERVARDYPGGREALIEKKTEAWGWRGLVAPSDDHRVAAEIPLREIGPAIESLLRWGVENTLACLPCPEQREAAEAFATRLLETLREWCRLYPDWALPELYQQILRYLYSELLGYEPLRAEATSTSDLLTLDAGSAGRPRFRLLDYFLRPETRAACERAYDAALEGSAMYTLQRFGPGAIPFDVVVPQRGRGTLRVTDRYVVIMTPRPMFFGLRRPIRSALDLASWLQSVFGRPVPVVGKAVTLVSMLASEFLFVFHEEGSPYVKRTRRMNDLLHRAGIQLPQHPILRVRYETWSSLDTSPVWLRLPEHLACAFGQDEIQGPALGQRWRAVLEEQRALLGELRNAQRPRDLTQLLCDRGHGRWDLLCREYRKLTAKTSELEAEDEAFKSQIKALFDDLRNMKREYASLERAKGEDFRARLWPLLQRRAAGETLDQEIREQEERRSAEFDLKATLLKSRLRECRAAIAEARARRRAAFDSAEARAIREARRSIEREAELARLRLVRMALLTVHGLSHTNHRPSAWWLPMLSPDGAWFRRIAETTEMYLEPLVSLG